MNTCFECGNLAEENHHVVPKSLGGTKTIPLCTLCHGKVHDFSDNRKIFWKTLRDKGIQKAKRDGKYKGRKKGTSYSNEQMLERHGDIVELLSNSNLPHTKIAKNVGKGLSTVKRVRDILKCPNGEMVDTLGSKPSAERRVGSNPTQGTK